MEVGEIISAVGGSLFGAFSTFFLQKKRENRDDFSVVITEYKALFQSMKNSFIEAEQREKKCEENIAMLEQKIEELRKQTP